MGFLFFDNIVIQIAFQLLFFYYARIDVFLASGFEQHPYAFYVASGEYFNFLR